MKDPFLLILASAARSLTRCSRAVASGLAPRPPALSQVEAVRGPRASDAGVGGAEPSVFDCSGAAGRLEPL